MLAKIKDLSMNIGTFDPKFKASATGHGKSLSLETQASAQQHHQHSGSFQWVN
jgi:hypothetical protein